MTDVEKQLRELAQTFNQFNLRTQARFRDAASPSAVLALLDRIEALEKQAADAERKGAEEMRETAAKRLEWRGAECWVGDSTTATTMRRVYSEEANEIRRLPLPGGEEKKS